MMPSSIITLGQLQLLDTEPRPLPSPDPARKMYHIATVLSGLREFALILDTNSRTYWLNEVIGTHVEEIKSDELFRELWRFLYDHGVIRNAVRPSSP